MATRRKPTDREAGEALRKARGLSGEAAAFLGSSREELERIIEGSRHLQELKRGIAGANLDRAEAKLLTAIDEGKITAITFYLRTKGATRGYGGSSEREADAKEREESEARGMDLSGLSDQELNELERLIEKARARPRKGPGRPAAAD